MDVQLRTVETPEDARLHLPWLRERGSEALAELGLAQAPEDFMETFLASHFGAPETLLLVAETGPGAADVGFVLVGPQVDPLSGVRTPMILILSVEPGLRHRGLARSLVQEAARQLSRRGYRQIAARCPQGDDPLIAMGERWGFVRTWEFLARD